MRPFLQPIDLPAQTDFPSFLGCTTRRERNPELGVALELKIQYANNRGAVGGGWDC